MSVVSAPSRAVSSAVLRVLAVFVAAHGVAHFVGTTRTFAKAADGGSLDYLGGAWSISDPTLLRAFGVLWALAGAAMLLAAVAIATARSVWPVVLGAVSLASLALVVVSLWASAIGLPIDVVLLAAAIAVMRRREPVRG